MTAYIIFCIGLTLAYVGIIASYVYAWHQTPNWHIPASYVPQISVTVLVPARNEAENIAACLQAISAGNYPSALLEVLVIDDFSTDETAQIVSKLADSYQHRVRLLRLADLAEPASGGKKQAISLGVEQARGELIISTDADCIQPKDWLRLMVSMFEHRRPGAIAGPVGFCPTKNGLERFQALDLAGMMAITGGGLQKGWHRMGNGASLCYPKAVFQALGGYSGMDERASGDDLFILQKIARSQEVIFLKNAAATVLTAPAPTWTSFFQQRLRWGTKNASLPEPGIKIVLAVVFFLCSTIVANAILLFVYSAIFWVLLLQLLTKAIADYLMLQIMCTFFGRRALMRTFGLSFIFHVLYITGLGFMSLVITKYTWKGRVLK